MAEYPNKVRINKDSRYFGRTIRYFIHLITRNKPILDKIKMGMFESLQEQPQIRWILHLNCSKQEHKLTKMQKLVHLSIPIKDNKN